MGERITAPKLIAMKARGERIVCLTAYDATFGRIADRAGVDVILVGDSLGNVVLGYATTVSVTLAEMVHHTRATRRGVSQALLVADLPFGTYQSSVAQAVDSAVELVRAGAEAVKLEGDYPEAIAAMVKAGIPVMGHLGFTPQSVNKFGGYRVQGKGDAGEGILRVAAGIETAGAFSIVFELVPAQLAAKASQERGVPIIGIGAGVGCDGQIQVLHDALGLAEDEFKHAKAYIDGKISFEKALQSYSEEVRGSKFPGVENSF